MIIFYSVTNNNLKEKRYFLISLLFMQRSNFYNMNETSNNVNETPNNMNETPFFNFKELPKYTNDENICLYMFTRN